CSACGSPPPRRCGSTSTTARPATLRPHGHAADPLGLSVPSRRAGRRPAGRRPPGRPGDWYALVYTESAATPGAFQVTATTAPVVLGGVTPDRVGIAAETVLTVTRAGFTAGAAVELGAAS